MKYLTRLGTALALLCAAGAFSSVHAGGFGIPEYGTRRTGMGAIIGRPDEPAAVYQNPAGLTELSGIRVYIGFGLAAVSSEFRLAPWDRSDELIDAPVDSEGYYPAVKPTRAIGAIPMIVVSSDLWKQRLYGALSLYVSNATGAQFERESVAHYHLIDGYVIAPQLSLSLAYKINPRLSVGGSFGIMNLRVHGNRYLFPIINGSDVPRQLFGSEPELTIDGSDWQPTWNLGIYARPLDKLTVGAAIIGKVTATLEGPLKLEPSADAADPSVLTGYQYTDQMLPWTFQAGANYDVHPNLEVGGDFRYWLYRQYDQQYTAVNGIALVQELVTQKNYHDSMQGSGGVRLHGLDAMRDVELMLGGHYDKTPAPAQTVTLDQPTFSHFGLHSGVRWSTGRWRLSGTYVHYWYDIPQIHDSITNPPSNVKGHGGNNIFSVSVEATVGSLH